MLLKTLLALGLLLAITELLIPSIFGLDQGVLSGLLNSARFNIAASNQVAIQQREKRERNYALPPQDQFVRMQREKTYCTANDDCIIDPDTLVDCNAVAHNKYYSCEGSTCAQTKIACPKNMYFVCESNKCVKKTIEL